MIKIEIRMPVEAVFFWFNSKCALYCIKNKTLRLKHFTACRIDNIYHATDPGQWFYVPTDLNPADCTTTGTNDLHVWLHGPEFLRQSIGDWSSVSDVELSSDVVDDDKTHLLATAVDKSEADLDLRR